MVCALVCRKFANGFGLKRRGEKLSNTPNSEPVRLSRWLFADLFTIKTPKLLLAFSLQSSTALWPVPEVYAFLVPNFEVYQH